MRKTKDFGRINNINKAKQTGKVSGGPNPSFSFKNIAKAGASNLLAAGGSAIAGPAGEAIGGAIPDLIDRITGGGDDMETEEGEGIGGASGGGEIQDVAMQVGCYIYIIS